MSSVKMLGVLKMKSYIIYKLGRKSSPEMEEMGNVFPGIQMDGVSATVLVPTDEAIAWAHNYGACATEEEKEALYQATKSTGLFDFDRQWEEQEDLQPKIGWPIYCRGNRISAGYVRTSAVRSYYKHLADSSDHPDKLVLPAEFPEDDLYNFKMPEMKEGDYLIATANSIYYLQLHKEE